MSASGLTQYGSLTSVDNALGSRKSRYERAEAVIEEGKGIP